ncbi:MAG: TetR/AcrR family transcriptional regulator [Actinobacteria bacterium]|nr:TetR/AcrR family transcriptional regulator [Actinomycetota bacterium]
MPMSGLRARVRAELTAEIKALARQQMATHGSASLSLRAIARDLGMVSSAIYRYFPSRDELLTALIIDAYNELGDAAERADAIGDRDDLTGRWRRVGDAAFSWARANTAEYGLVFGTPVPGYAAPVDTIEPATRFTRVLIGLLADAARLGVRPAVTVEAGPTVHRDLDRLRADLGVDIDDVTFLAGMQTWMALFGAITFILFGQLNNVITDVDEFFAVTVEALGRQVFPVTAHRVTGTA